MYAHVDLVAADPVYRDHLRRANEARAAAFYGTIRGAGRRCAALWEALASRLAAWQARRASLRQLARLSPRSLDDIGLVPADLDALVQGRLPGLGGTADEPAAGAATSRPAAGPKPVEAGRPAPTAARPRHSGPARLARSPGPGDREAGGRQAA